MSFFTGKKLFLIGFIAVLLAVIPVTVYFLQKQTQTKSGATKATTLYFALPGTTEQINSLQKNNGNGPFSLDVIMNPGTNQVIASTLYITYDPTVLSVQNPPGLQRAQEGTQGFTSTLAGPTYGNGYATISMAVGVDVTKILTTTQKIATISFNIIGTSSSNSQIAFDETKTGVTSSVDPEVNVLSTTHPVLLTLSGTGPSDTPTLTLTPTPTGSITPTPSPTGPTPTGPTPTPTNTLTPTPTGTGISNQVPVCTGLNVDRTTSGTAPFSITFTANGNDPDGTITKVTFDFGDGPVTDVTSGGGIGTKTVSTQIAHTYNNSGTFKAKATLTDDKNGISTTSDSCSQTITVTGGTSGGGGGSTTEPTATPVIIASNPTATPATIGSPGPEDTVIGAGVLGLGIAILGGIIFLAL